MALLQLAKKDMKREMQTTPLYELPEEYLRLEYPQEWNYIRKIKSFADKALLIM